jgi:hypothetical protein
VESRNRKIKICRRGTGSGYIWRRTSGKEPAADQKHPGGDFGGDG